MLSFSVGDTNFYTIIFVDILGENDYHISKISYGPTSNAKTYQYDDNDFVLILRKAMNLICDEKPGVFMSLYRGIKNDEVAFPIAEEIRQSKDSFTTPVFKETE